MRFTFSRRRSWLLVLLLVAGCDGFGLLGGDGRIYSGGKLFGYSVALDGDRAIVGAFETDEAFILGRAGEWETEARLEPPEGLPDNDRVADAYFGLEVDIDGPIAVVGTPATGVMPQDYPGQVFVFERMGGEWNRTADIGASDPTQRRLFGRSVAVLDGRIAVVEGAAVEPITANLIEPAAVVFYERSGAGWTETSRIEETDYQRPTGLGGPSGFGSDLALDGDRAAVGSSGQTVGGAREVGVVRVYERVGVEWSLSATLSAPSFREREFLGESVALDGSVLAATARNRQVDEIRGSAFVFRESASGWETEAELRPDGLTSQDFYGSSIAASGDRVAVGARSRAQFRGSVFVWVRLPSGEWELEAELWPKGLRRGSFGESVALEGDQLLVGANTANNGKGAVYAFRRGPEGWVQEGR